MSAALRLKRIVPAPLWSTLRRAWYGVKALRFAGQYRDGLLFDLFRRDYATEGMVFTIPRSLTRRAHRARFWRDTHEREERALVKQHLPSDACVLELGACMGVVSGVINRRLSFPERHVAVEANPHLIAVLEGNRARNRLSFTIHSGLISRTSDGVFFLSDCFVMSSGDQAVGERVTVPVMTVDDLEAGLGRQFDAVFMDIQGGEEAFLWENPQLLRRCRCVILELHPHIIGSARCQHCRDMLAESGLTLKAGSGLVEVWARSNA
jgi:FkbM family methyltransferase